MNPHQYWIPFFNAMTKTEYLEPLFTLRRGQKYEIRHLYYFFSDFWLFVSGFSAILNFCNYSAVLNYRLIEINILKVINIIIE